MRLIKIEDGLLEQENFFQVSPFSNFVGDFNGRRDYSEDKFELYSGYIERKFEYEQYVIIVRKQGSPLTSEEDNLIMYVREDGNRAGLKESFDLGGGTFTYWKMLRYDGFTEAYASGNGVDWEHLGGGDTPPTKIQGFEIQGNSGFNIMDYQVYKNPYITLYGFNEGDICVIEDEHNNEVSVAIFDSDGKAELLLENVLSGRFVVKDKVTNTTLYSSDIITLQFGDVFSITEFVGLDLIYKGRILDYTPTLLHSRRELVTLKNSSNTTYTDIGITPIIPNPHNTDIIEVSFDNDEFYSSITLDEIEPEQEVDIYIKIIKDRGVKSYSTRHFILELD